MNWELTVGCGFIVGAIFWCGATYNRVVSIENTLTEIKQQLPALAKVAVLESQLSSLADRMAHIQGTVEALRAK